MQIHHTIASLRAARALAGKVAFVPTMGNLHEGHITLMREAHEKADCVIVSIFVNRLQFGAGEDFDHYPRTLAADCEMLAAAGVKHVFTPDEAELIHSRSAITSIRPRLRCRFWKASSVLATFVAWRRWC